MARIAGSRFARLLKYSQTTFPASFPENWVGRGLATLQVESASTIRQADRAKAYCRVVLSALFTSLRGHAASCQSPNPDVPITSRWQSCLLTNSTNSVLEELSSLEMVESVHVLAFERVQNSSLVFIITLHVCFLKSVSLVAFFITPFCPGLWF
jgi:hypothetical protein